MKRRSAEYYKLINNLFDTYLGELPEKFTYKGKEYTPKSFAESLGLNMDDYIELTSFTHKPYYQKFSPEVPDNWENEQKMCKSPAGRNDGSCRLCFDPRIYRMLETVMSVEKGF